METFQTRSKDGQDVTLHLHDIPEDPKAFLDEIGSMTSEEIVRFMETNESQKMGFTITTVELIAPYKIESTLTQRRKTGFFSRFLK